MSTVITRMLIAVVFATAAWLSWSESKLAARVADAKQDIATLTHDNVDALTPERALSDYLPGNERRLSDEIRIAKATEAYWLGRYGAVTADTADSKSDAKTETKPESKTESKTETKTATASPPAIPPSSPSPPESRSGSSSSRSCRAAPTGS